MRVSDDTMHQLLTFLCHDLMAISELAELVVELLNTCKLQLSGMNYNAGW